MEILLKCDVCILFSSQDPAVQCGGGGDGCGEGGGEDETV